MLMVIREHGHRSRTAGGAQVGHVASTRREVSGVGGTDMRTDFLVTAPDGARSVLEVNSLMHADLKYWSGRQTSNAFKVGWNAC